MTTAASISGAANAPQPPFTFFRPGELTLLVEPLPGALPDGADMVPAGLLAGLPALLTNQLKIALHPTPFAGEAGPRQAVLLQREHAGPLVLLTMNLANWYNEYAAHNPQVHAQVAARGKGGVAPATLVVAGPPDTFGLVRQAIVDVTAAVDAVNAAVAADREIPGKLRILAASPNWLASLHCF